MIKYIKGDLFTNTDAIFLHACNCMGNWGNGVALQFAKHFPKAYKRHQTLRNSPATVGSIQELLAEGRERTIICLFTSKQFGKLADPPEQILENTKKALTTLGLHYKDREVKIASPKINAGLFKCPWKNTEKLINDFLTENPNIEWSVYFLD